MLAKNVLRHRFSNLIRYRPFATQEVIHRHRNHICFRI